MLNTKSCFVFFYFCIALKLFVAFHSHLLHKRDKTKEERKKENSLDNENTDFLGVEGCITLLHYSKTFFRLIFFNEKVKTQPSF